MNITELETISFRAWAALQTEIYDGWVLRFADGYTGRANSVNPVYPSTLDLKEKIAYCASWYEERGILVRYRLNATMQPPMLDATLERMGYERSGESQVMTLQLSDTALLPEVPEVTIEGDLTETWLTNFCRLHPTHAPHLQTMRAIFERIEPQKYVATLFQDGEAAAMGLGVRDGGYIGLFDIITREDQRGKGFGKKLVHALLTHGQMDGAKIGYLQVASNNNPALNLYERIGFRKAYDYWYRSERTP